MRLFRRLPKWRLDQFTPDEMQIYRRWEAEEAIRRRPGYPVEFVCAAVPKHLQPIVPELFAEVHEQIASEKGALGITAEMQCIPVRCSVASDAGRSVWTITLGRRRSREWPEGLCGTARHLDDAWFDAERAALGYIRQHKGVVHEGVGSDGLPWREVIYGIERGRPQFAKDRFKKEHRVRPRVAREIEVEDGYRATSAQKLAILKRLREAAHPDRPGGSHELFIKRQAEYLAFKRRMGLL